MIDNVYLYTYIHIPEEQLSPMSWTLTENSFNKYYMKIINSVIFLYYFESQRFVIKGKLATLMNNSQVLNIDDVYGKDLPRFISDCNKRLTSLTGVSMDIQKFTPARIDFCFNVTTPYVHEYLEIMTAAEKAIDSSHRINFTDEFDLDGSVYIKTASDFKKKTRKCYTLNFYDKLDWIAYQREKKRYISKEDEERARDVLRLEVQLTNKYLKQNAKSRKLSLEFGSFLSFDVAYEAIEQIYGCVFGAGCDQSFYKYDVAKEAFRNGSAPRKTLELAAEHHKIKGKAYRYSVGQIKERGIYPYAFLPKDFIMDSLPSPLLLIKEKINAI